MKSEFKLITATLLIGLSAVAFSASLEAGALGDTVGGAVGGAKGAVGGALGGVGGALGSNSSTSGSTTAGAGAGAAVGNTTAKATVILRKKNFAKNQVTVTLGKTTNVNAKVLSAEIDVSLGLTSHRSGAAPVRRSHTAATQMFQNLSPGEQRKLVRKCSHVLASPVAFESDLVALCRMLAILDSQPAPRAKPGPKRKVSTAKPNPSPQRVAIMEIQPTTSALKADKPEVTHCLGDFALSLERLAELEKDLPGCVVWH